MESVLDRIPGGARVAVIRLRSLGDCVLTTPALEILRQARPDLRVAVVVEDRFRDLFSGNPSLDAVLPPSPLALARWRPRLVLNLHGGTRSLWLTALCGARFRAGFAHHTGAFLYNVPIPTAQETLGVARKVHTAEHLASAIFHLGAPATGIPRARLYADPPASGQPYAVLHPVASAPEKTWPAHKFLEVAEHLRTRHGLDPVFVGGADDDLSEFRRRRVVRGAPLRDTLSLIRGASFFVGNDSGPAHIAAAFSVPLVVIFGPSDPVVWAPWRAEAEVLVSREDIRRIETSQVTAAVDRLRVAA